MKVKIKTKKGLIPGEIVEQKYDKYKVRFSKYPDGSGPEKTNWFENKELIRLW